MSGRLPLKDVLEIRTPLIGCALLLFAAVGLSALVHWQLEMRKQRGTEFARELAHYRQQLMQAEEEQRLLSSLAERYAKLRNGASQRTPYRLQWLKSLHDAAARHHIGLLEYELAASEPLQPGAVAGLIWFKSSMKLRLTLLHEGKLLAMLEDLRQSRPGHFNIRSCHLERLPIAAADKNAKLKAECTIDWLNLQVKP